MILRAVRSVVEEKVGEDDEEEEEGIKMRMDPSFPLGSIYKIYNKKNVFLLFSKL